MTRDIHLEVLGTGSYLPEEVIGNDQFVGRLLTVYGPNDEVLRQKVLSAEDIIGTTGIRERRRALPTQLPSDLGYRAAVLAIERAGVKADSLVGIIMASVTEKSNFPSGACKIQEKLGAKSCSIAYDVNHACAGFTQGMITANAHVLRKEGNYLVVGSECLTRTGDPTDINSTLFGDGAGAVILGPTTSERGILGEYSKSDPFGGKLGYIFCHQKGWLRMPNGSLVLKNAVHEMVESARTLKRDLGWGRADVYIPHQANGRIIDEVEKRVQDDGARVYKNIDRCGNMSAATCAVALDEAICEKVIEKGSKVIVTSFASGLATSAVALQF